MFLYCARFEWDRLFDTDKLTRVQSRQLAYLSDMLEYYEYYLHFYAEYPPSDWWYTCE